MTNLCIAPLSTVYGHIWKKVEKVVVCVWLSNAISKLTTCSVAVCGVRWRWYSRWIEIKSLMFVIYGQAIDNFILKINLPWLYYNYCRLASYECVAYHSIIMQLSLGIEKNSSEKKHIHKQIIGYRGNGLMEWNCAFIFRILAEWMYFSSYFSYNYSASNVVNTITVELIPLPRCDSILNST